VDDALVDFEWKLHDLTEEATLGRASPEVEALVETYRSRLEAEFGQVIGEAEDSLGRSYSGESTLGNWITDTLRRQTGADIGLYNAGGIRADLASGPITKGDLFQIFPFSNAVVTFEISGSELVGILLRNVHAAVDGNHGSMQLSGAQMTWRMRMGVPEAIAIRVGDAPLDPDAAYTVATNTYVIDQAEKYLPGASPQNVVEQGETVFDAALRRVKEGPVVAPVEPRLIRVD
jgi:2',3'-cyclic-nucleotide 2'-phosphodiesterase (5'-nucleotidase family)